ncbi:hypothetical protein O7599_28690 [Streptomyces sp. WMMC500]|uniref:hypothetical protein n=1 Tax=Streptomyces sp. WMMC500 TaxID=3015154 RepID=UPI00248C3350|nr:hypothetical protein [Streptomyces sp. WMMC500]WBB59510.1 hypothetical protein O7599_28690 [Streptomyces sp. WMMC500]
MPFAFGIFGVLTYAIPGALQLSLATYVLTRLGIADVPDLSAGPAALVVIGAVGAVREGRRMQHWARLKTLELCFWIPGIDEHFRH